MRSLFLIFIILFAFAACKTTPSSEEQTRLSDSLFEAVMAGHDVAMPKMNKLERLQKETRAALDSIAKLPAAKQATLASYRTGLESTLKALDEGSRAMMDWMNGFKYDSLKNNEPERIKYLQSELEKVNKMKDAVLNGIAKADSVLAK